MVHTGTISAGTVLTPDDRYEGAEICVEDGLIKAVRTDPDTAAEATTLHVPDGIVVPGFVDVHVHGYCGYSTNTSEPENIRGIAEAVTAHGVTTVFPTTMSSTLEATSQACRAFAETADETVGARLEGIHLEGPHLNPAQSGAQNRDVLRSPDVAELEQLLTDSNDSIARLTIAPELDGAVEYIQAAREAGIVVSAGHSDANYEQAIRAFDVGVECLTHLYNAMSGGHHRRPGLVGAGLTRDDVAIEIIADLIHLHEASIDVAIRSKPPEKILLVTDAVPPAGLPDGEYELHGQPVVLEDGTCRLSDGGGLAGSTLTMDRAVSHLVEHVGVDLREAVRYASTNPACEQGLTDRGRIEPGYRADLTILNGDLSVVATVVGGEIVYDKYGGAG